MTAPTPAMAPSTIIAFTGPSGKSPLTASDSHATPASIQSIGYCPSVKVAVNIMKRNRKKSGKPRYLCVRTLSTVCVML